MRTGGEGGVKQLPRTASGQTPSRACSIITFSTFGLNDRRPASDTPAAAGTPAAADTPAAAAIAAAAAAAAAKAAAAKAAKAAKAKAAKAKAATHPATQAAGKTNGGFYHNSSDEDAEEDAEEDEESDSPDDDLFLSPSELAKKHGSTKDWKFYDSNAPQPPSYLACLPLAPENAIGRSFILTRDYPPFATYLAKEQAGFLGWMSTAA